MAIAAASSPLIVHRRAQPLRGEAGEAGEDLRVHRGGLVLAEALRDREEERAQEQVALHRDLLQRDDQRGVRQVLELEVGVEVAVVVVPPAGLGVRRRPVDRDRRRSATRPTTARFGWASTGSFAASISTVQWQCGSRSAGRRGGRWRGRTCARGFVATAVASNVGSSIVWHMPRTYSSPIGSTSIERAAVREPELAVVRVVHPAAEVHELVGRADVELEVLHDRRHVAVGEVERALGALRVDRARTHPLDDGDLLHRLAGPALVHQRHPDPVLEVTVEQPFTPEHRQRPPGERREVERRVEGSRVVVDQLGGLAHGPTVTRVASPGVGDEVMRAAVYVGPDAMEVRDVPVPAIGVRTTP